MNDQQAEHEIQDKELAAPKLTPEDIEGVIVSEHYFTAADGAFQAGRGADYSEMEWLAIRGPLQLVTFCVLLLRNGAKVTGVNHGPVSAANFDAAKGREYARANAIEKVWELEGYALRERLYAIATAIPPSPGGDKSDVAASIDMRETFPGEDRVAVPRGLIGAACSTIDKKRTGRKVLDELRRYTVGDLSAALSADPDMATAALRKAAEAMRAFTDPEGNMPAKTGEFDDLKSALDQVEAALAGAAA